MNDKLLDIHIKVNIQIMRWSYFLAEHRKITWNMCLLIHLIGHIEWKHQLKKMMISKVILRSLFTITNFFLRHKHSIHVLISIPKYLFYDQLHSFALRPKSTSFQIFSVFAKLHAIIMLHWKLFNLKPSKLSFYFMHYERCTCNYHIFFYATFFPNLYCVSKY